MTQLMTIKLLFFIPCAVILVETASVFDHEEYVKTLTDSHHRGHGTVDGSRRDASVEPSSEYFIIDDFRRDGFRLPKPDAPMKPDDMTVEEWWRKINGLKIEYKKQDWYYQEYNPNIGYEPYWVAGDWVLTDLHNIPSNLPDNKKPTYTLPAEVCNEECPHQFHKVGKVCAVMLDRAQSNTPMSKLSEFQTFNTFCEFLDAKCRAEKLRQYWDRFTPYNTVWQFLHLGSCGAHDTYFPRMDTVGPLESTNKYLSDVKKRLGYKAFNFD